MPATFPIWEYYPANPLLIDSSRSWTWDRIAALISCAGHLSDISITNVSNLAFTLYGYLPDGRVELEELINTSKRLYRRTFRYSCPAPLRQYRNQLRAVVNAARMKLGTVLTRPNQRGWSKEAWRLYQEIQINLGKRTDVYFGTITFRTLLDYQQTNQNLRDIQRNILWREGFECVTVIAWHARSRSEVMRYGVGRIHAHIMVWSRETRPAREIVGAMRRVRAALTEGRYGTGLFRLQRPRDFLSAAAYVAWNYDSTKKLDKGEWNPIPCGAKIVRRPRNSAGIERWRRVGSCSFLNPSATAWRTAVERHAEATGRVTSDNLAWIWRERRQIRALLDPPRYRPPSINGLDGFGYTVSPFGEDAEGRECFLLSNDLRGGFILTVEGLAELASMEVGAGVFRQDWRKDLTTGCNAIWRDVWGLNLDNGWFLSTNRGGVKRGVLDRGL